MTEGLATTGHQSGTPVSSDTAHADEVQARVVEVGGVPMSALVRTVPQPRAVVVALHGGAASAAYFHHPDHPRLSLLEVGAALGFTVIALDRPGYGASAPHAEAMRSADRRVALSYAAVDAIIGSGSRGAGVFLVGHSAGCELATRMAAAGAADLLGVELAGTGTRFQPAADEILAESRRTAVAGKPGRPTGLQGILWQPRSLYPDGVVGGAHFVSRAPLYEGEVLTDWVPRELAPTAARVRVPVMYTLGDHDTVWRTDPASMNAIAALFTAAPRVVVNVQVDSGHNLSLGRTATAYHLRVLSFVEECVEARAES